MFNKTLVASALAVALPVFAVDPSWTLSKDQFLNGVIENPTDQVLTYTLTHGKFGASSDSNTSFFMGQVIGSGSTSVLNFQEINENDVLKYVGVPSEAGYQGTWHSTNGASGDFNMDLNGNSLGNNDGIFQMDIGYIQKIPDALIIAGANNHITEGHSHWRNATTGQPMSNGRWYWEVEFKAGTHFMVGVDNVSSHDYVPLQQVANYYPSQGYVNCQNGNGAQAIPYGKTLSHGDIISVMLDLEARTISFGINGEDQGVSCTDFPDTVYLATAVYDSTVLETNFGQDPWAYPHLAQ